MKYLPARNRQRKGLAVVELLIALAIGATMLVAVAYTVDAAFRAYSINQEQSDLMQHARLAMHRVITGIRATGAHQPINDLPLFDFKAGRVSTDVGIVMTDANGEPVGFRFDPVNRMLLGTDRTGSEYVILRGVEKFEVKFEPMQTLQSKRTGGPYDRLRRATVLLTVKTEGRTAYVDRTVAAQRVTLSSSAMPRRNIW